MGGPQQNFYFCSIHTLYYLVVSIVSLDVALAIALYCLGVAIALAYYWVGSVKEGRELKEDYLCMG